MSTQDENRIDKLFRDGMTGAEDHASFREDDWDALEDMLNNSTRKRGMINIYSSAASGIAAMLLLTLGWFYLNPSAVYQKPVKTSIVAKNKSNADTTGHSAQHQQDAALNTVPMVKQPGITVLPAASLKGKPIFNLSTNYGRRHTGFVRSKAGNAPEVGKEALTSNSITNNAARVNQAGIANNTISLQTDSTLSTGNALTANAIAPGNINQIRPDDTVNTNPVKPVIKKAVLASAGFKPGFAISILSAPDVNGAGGFAESKVGFDAGLQFSIQLSRKISVTTGAAYAIKPYNSEYGAYKYFSSWGTQPSAIFANCKVLDIPVNVNYQLYNKRRNSFSLGTGLSSYFMLRESYHFDYDAARTGISPLDVNLSNQNKHLFGVLNLNVTYTRQVNAKFGLLIQPYYKIPLTKIGFTQSNLQSAGIAVGVQMNLRSAKRPFKK